MRTTVDINKELLEEAKKFSKAKSKKDTIELALEEFVLRKKAKKLIELEGKISLSYSYPDLLARRKKDVPD